MDKRYVFDRFTAIKDINYMASKTMVHKDRSNIVFDGFPVNFSTYYEVQPSWQNQNCLTGSVTTPGASPTGLTLTDLDPTMT